MFKLEDGSWINVNAVIVMDKSKSGFLVHLPHSFSYAISEKDGLAIGKLIEESQRAQKSRVTQGGIPIQLQQMPNFKGN